jgi:hypothetical protein
MGTRKSAAATAVEAAEEQAQAAEQEANDWDAAAPDVEEQNVPDVEEQNVPTNEGEQAPDKSEAELKREAYSAAETRLRDKYKDEFKSLVKDEASKRGVTYTFRPTPQEKAKAQMEKLLAENPELAGMLAHTE